MIAFTVLTAILAGAVRSGSSVLYATLGELVAERAGVTNLGVEGCMLVGACIGFVETARSGNVLLGLLAAALAGALLALLHGYLVIARKANQLASGLSVWFFGLGITALIGAPYVKANIGGLNPQPIPGLSALPFVGPVLFNHDVMTYVAYLLAPAIWFVLFRTKVGIDIRAVGERADVAFAAGLRPGLIQYGAVAFGGMMAGLGGAQLSVAYTHTWVENMTAGRGFIAVALVIFALWQPWRAVAGAILFGSAVAAQFQVQTLGWPISPSILEMLPYLLTLFVLLFAGDSGKRAMPEGLKLVFRSTA